MQRREQTATEKAKINGYKVTASLFVEERKQMWLVCANEDAEEDENTVQEAGLWIQAAREAGLEAEAVKKEWLETARIEFAGAKRLKEEVEIDAIGASLRKEEAKTDAKDKFWSAVDAKKAKKVKDLYDVEQKWKQAFERKKAICTRWMSLFTALGDTTPSTPTGMLSYFFVRSMDGN
jgi:hypothetical protein